MLAIPELAMPRSRKVTTVCNGRREVWTDYEEAKAYFLDLMMSHFLLNADFFLSLISFPRILDLSKVYPPIIFSILNFNFFGTKFFGTNYIRF